jgi:hypothetical protein
MGLATVLAGHSTVAMGLLATKTLTDGLLLAAGARSLGRLRIMRGYVLYPLWFPVSVLLQGVAFAWPGPVVWKGRRYR